MGGGSADDLLARGSDALGAGEWEVARSCFAEAREQFGDTAEVLDGLSHAAHFQGEHAEAIEVKERAFAAYSRAGKRVKAAEAARWLAFLHGAVDGNRAAANGWMSRAERLLEGEKESVEHGRLALDRAPGPTTRPSGSATRWQRSRSPGASAIATSSSARRRCSATRMWSPGASTKGCR